MKKMYPLISLLFVLCLLTSCETIQTFTEHAMGALGLDSKAPTEKSDKKENKKRQSKQQNQKRKPTPRPNQNEKDIIITKKDEINRKKVGKKDLKNAEKPQFRVEAPVDVTKRVGGAARMILSDSKYLYLDFPQHFTVYDYDLNFLARIPTAFPVKDVTRVTIRDKTFLYLKEEKDVLSIVELVKEQSEDGEKYSLKDIGSYEELGGPSRWLDETTLLLFLDKKVQFLDLSNFEEAKIISELPIAEVNDAYHAGKYLYLSRNGFLDIINLDDLKILSSLRIGKNFGFLGLSSQKQPKTLKLSLLKNEEVIEGIQTLQLKEDLSAVVEFGNVQFLEKPLKNFFYSSEKKLLLGEEFSEEEKNPIRLYSLTHEKFLRGDLSNKTDLMAWSLNGPYAFLVTPLDISIHQIQLNENVIKKAHQLERLMNNRSKQIPLAQIGAQKTFKEEYQLTPVRSIEFMADAHKVALLDENHFIVFENRQNKNIHEIFTATNFMDDNFIQKSPKIADLTFFNKILPTDFGLLTYSQETNKIYFMGIDLQTLSSLPVKARNLISWTNFTSPMGEILITSTAINNQSSLVKRAKSSKKKTKEAKIDSSLTNSPKSKRTTTLENAKYLIEIHWLKSPTEIETIAQLAYAEKPFVIRNHSNNLIVLTQSGGDFYNMENPRKPQLNEFDSIEFATPYAIKTVKPFLVNYRLFTLIEEDDRNKIMIFSINNEKQKVVLSDFEILESHFDGSSFSKGGQLFILPSIEGTLFYDMTSLEEKKEDERIVAHWPLPSEYVDIAKSGRFVCVALGAKGVYCGDLLFY